MKKKMLCIMLAMFAFGSPALFGMRNQGHEKKTGLTRGQEQDLFFEINRKIQDGDFSTIRADLNTLKSFKLYKGSQLSDLIQQIEFIVSTIPKPEPPKPEPEQKKPEIQKLTLEGEYHLARLKKEDPESLILNYRLGDLLRYRDSALLAKEHNLLETLNNVIRVKKEMELEKKRHEGQGQYKRQYKVLLPINKRLLGKIEQVFNMDRLKGINNKDEFKKRAKNLIEDNFINDITKVFKNLLSFKEQVKALLVKSFIMYGGTIVREWQQKKFANLYWCICSGGPIESRVYLMLYIMNEFAVRAKEQEINIVSFGSGMLAQEYLIVKALRGLGFKKINMHAIDVGYEEKEWVQNAFKSFKSLLEQNGQEAASYTDYQGFLKSCADRHFDLALLIDPGQNLGSSKLKMDKQFYDMVQKLQMKKGGLALELTSYEIYLFSR